MAAYPRTYLVSRGWKVFLIGLSLLLGIPSVLGMFYFGAGHQGETKSQIHLMVGICLIFIALCAYLILTTLRSKIVLFADRIEIHELTVTRTLRRDEIAGWRVAANGALILERKQPVGKIVSTALLYNTDADFDLWFAELDNLDLRDEESALNEIANNDSLGSDEQERFQHLAQVKWLTRVLNVLGGVLFVWGTFRPTPYRLVIVLLLLAPWLAVLVAWRSSGLIQFDERPNDVKPSIWLLAAFPMLALVLRAILDYETVGWITQTVAAFLIGAVLFAAQKAAHADLRAHRFTAVISFFFAFLAYGYGAALHINALADSSDIQQTRYLLREKYVSKGKVIRYQVRLNKAHMDAPEVGSAEVTQYFYDMLKPGDAICLAFRSGALGIKWFSAGPCPLSMQ
ncbi:hypothetical protein [Bryobacter aggregatus]|uniref:hypothetical protein n=1 Tax=Bryobacter aggregatus TaxID=360054 RepID=UPI0004E20701|nr:hypothetical protein [Bryobacter aggregatus]